MRILSTTVLFNICDLSKNLCYSKEVLYNRTTFHNDSRSNIHGVRLPRTQSVANFIGIFFWQQDTFLSFYILSVMIIERCEINNSLLMFCFIINHSSSNVIFTNRKAKTSSYFAQLGLMWYHTYCINTKHIIYLHEFYTQSTNTIRQINLHSPAKKIYCITNVHNVFKSLELTSVFYINVYKPFFLFFHCCWQWLDCIAFVPI